MKWKTRLTDLLGCKYPILEGAFHYIGTWELASAISEAGAVGCITASTYNTPDGLRDAIRKLRQVTSNPFTVNISIGLCPHVDGMFDVCFEEKVTIETAGFKPNDYAKRIKDSGVIWIHKAATVDYCKNGEQLGADAVVLVGLEGYGFKNIKQLPTFTSIAWAAKQINVPLIAAGGIGNGHTFLGALGLGADGIYVGTAFEATKECRLREKIKQNMVDASPDQLGLIYELLAPPKQEDYAAVTAARDTMPLEEWIKAMEAIHLKRDDWKEFSTGKIDVDSFLEGDAFVIKDKIKGPYSFACAHIDQIYTCRELIERIVNEAEDILRGWEFLKTL